MLGQDRYGFDKKSIGTRYAKLVFLHPVGSAGHVVQSGTSEVRNVDAHFFHARVGMVRIKQTTCQDMLRRTCDFASGGICGGHIEHSGVSKAQYVNTLFFMLRRAWCGFQKKCTEHVTPNWCFSIYWDLRVT
jgi:hypothetical protein